MHESPNLEEQILAALTQALGETRPEVVEHLLRALEALSTDARSDSSSVARYSSMLNRAASTRMWEG
jgi:hypothetical protein